jgi:hypothetical protein
MQYFENVDIAMVSAVQSGESEPKTFEEAWEHPVPTSRSKWRMPIQKEIEDMINKEVW